MANGVDFTDIPAYTDSSILDGQDLHLGGSVSGTVSVNSDAVKVLRLAAVIIIASLVLLWLGAFTFKG